VGRLAIAVALFVFAAAGCVTLGPIKTKRKEARVEVEQVLENWIGDRAGRFLYEVGESDHPQGMSRLTLDRRGHFVVEESLGGKEHRWEATDIAAARELVKTLAAHRISNVREQREDGVPGERTVTLRIEAAELAAPFETRLWAGEADEQPDFGAITKAIGNVLQRSLSRLWRRGHSVTQPMP
jgi:hypothetical protein